MSPQHNSDKMSPTKTFQCIVDDTALITNISEIEAWVLRGVVNLVIPLHTLERLNLLKKDTSQIGQNARKAVKFLDEVTSNTDIANRIIIQGPDERYTTWNEVEAHYTENTTEEQDGKGKEVLKMTEDQGIMQEEHAHVIAHVDNDLSEVLKSKLDVEQEPQATSPMSTPPLSPSSSGPQSSKPSPEVKSASIIASDVSPVPQTLKPLINPVVWYTHERKSSSADNVLVFLTNSSDSSYLARDFGVMSKNIHQLRAAIGVEEQEANNHDKYTKKQGRNPKPPSEPRTLFRYEDEESEEEELVFKPRGRGGPRGSSGARNGNVGSTKSKASHGHSPSNSMNAPAVSLPAAATTTPNKPQIPTEEIDPDSFDRGSFARGSTPLVSVGNNQPSQSLPSYGRGQMHRGGHASNGGSSRGFHRGGSRGGHDRGVARGRGRLFVP